MALASPLVKRKCPGFVQDAVSAAAWLEMKSEIKQYKLHMYVLRKMTSKLLQTAQTSTPASQITGLLVEESRLIIIHKLHPELKV